MRQLMLCAAVILCTEATAKTPEEEIRFAPAPDWVQVSEPLPVPDNTSGLIFVRRQNVSTHLDENGTTYHTASLFRIIHPNALQLGNIAFNWNPAAGKAVVHAVKVHRNGSVRDVLNSTKFQILQREDQLEAAMLDGMLTATLRVPDLRVGDELELSFSLPVHDPTLGRDSFGALFLNDEPPPGRYNVRLSWSPGQEPKILPSADLAGKIERTEGSASYTIDMPGATKPPKDAPPRYNWNRMIAFSDFASWQDLSSRFAPLYDKAATLTPKSKLRGEAAAIAAATNDPRERAAAALKLVQQEVRYVYVGFNGGNFTPAAIDETWERRYGDCKGKTVLLLALLKELGIEAEPVLVSNSGTDDGLDERLPSPVFFDHVLVRARINGEVLWMDGTLPQVATPSREPLVPYRWVLPISMAGAAIERVEWKPAVHPNELVLNEIDARSGFDGPVPMKLTMISRGLEALKNYYQAAALTNQQLLDSFKNAFEDGETWVTVDSVNWRFDTESQASVLELTGTGKVDWSKDGKTSRSLEMPGGGFSAPSRRQRVGGDQTIPFYQAPEFSCHATTVRLPLKTSEKDWSFNAAFSQLYFGESYNRNFERRDGAIRLIRSKRTLTTEITPQSAARDNERIEEFDNSKGQIFWDLDSGDVKKQTFVVPATYEIDWLRDDSACLAPKRRA